MALLSLIKRLFGRKTGVARFTEELKLAGDAVKELTDDELKQMIESDDTKPWFAVEAAHHLALHHRVDLLRVLPRDRSNVACAAIDGLCCAACNGVDGAIEHVEAFLDHANEQVRLRAVRSLFMIVRGTPGDCGSSTDAIRKKGREILFKARSDADFTVRETATQALDATKHVCDVQRGQGVLTYVGSRAAEEVIKIAEAEKH